MKKVSNQKSFVRSNPVRYKSHNTDSIPTHFIKNNVHITRNSNITTTRLVFVRLRFYAVSSRLLLSLWHSNDPEPTIHLFLLESKPQYCPAS